MVEVMSIMKSCQCVDGLQDHRIQQSGHLQTCTPFATSVAVQKHVCETVLRALPFTSLKRAAGDKQGRRFNMANRYGDRDYDRGQQNYGRRSDADYDRSVGERYGYGRDENERERYDVESRWRGQSGTGSSAEMLRTITKLAVKSTARVVGKTIGITLVVVSATADTWLRARLQRQPAITVARGTGLLRNRRRTL